jgi:hypothetical protein
MKSFQSPKGQNSPLDYRMAKAHSVYMGNRRMDEGKIEIMPVLEILKNFKRILAPQKGH